MTTEKEYTLRQAAADLAMRALSSDKSYLIPHLASQIYDFITSGSIPSKEQTEQFKKDLDYSTEQLL